MQGNLLLIDMKEHRLADLLANPMFQELAGLNKDKIEGCQECEFRYCCFDYRPDVMGTSINLYQKPSCGYDPRTALSDS